MGIGAGLLGRYVAMAQKGHQRKPEIGQPHIPHDESPTTHGLPMARFNVATLRR